MLEELQAAGEIDFLDEITYKLYGYLSSWYNPLERFESKQKLINSISEEFNDYQLGDELDKKYYLEKQEAMLRKERQKIPKELGKKQILDMHYLHNPA